MCVIVRYIRELPCWRERKERVCDERWRTLAVTIKHNRVILICLKVFTGSTETLEPFINSTANVKTMQEL